MNHRAQAGAFAHKVLREMTADEAAGSGDEDFFTFK
jgi:hypothetical protein